MICAWTSVLLWRTVPNFPCLTFGGHSIPVVREFTNSSEMPGHHSRVHGGAKGVTFLTNRRWRWLDRPQGPAVEKTLPPRKRGGKHHAGAPDFTSLYTMESISAWNEASMILGDTPMVVQRSPLSSSLSISTRVTAPVPALRMRTR